MGHGLLLKLNHNKAHWIGPGLLYFALCFIWHCSSCTLRFASYIPYYISKSFASYIPYYISKSLL